MSASRHAPGHGGEGLTLAIVLSYAFRLAWAWLLSLPIVNAVSASGLLDFPNGDSELFASGGLYLLETLQRQQSALAAAVFPTALLLLLASFASSVPQFYVLSALGSRPPGEDLSSQGARAIPRLALLGAATWVVRAILALSTLSLALTVRSYFTSALDERLPDLVFVGVVLGGGALQLGLSLLHDLIGTALVAAHVGLGRASGLALRTLQRCGLSLLGRYAIAGLASLTLLAACAVAVSALDVARTGTWRTWLSFGAHQLAVVASLLLRVWWLARARRALSALTQSAREAHAEAFL